jgi:hypothetical protein
VTPVPGEAAPLTTTVTSWKTSPVTQVPRPALSANTRTVSEPEFAVNVSLQVKTLPIRVQAWVAAAAFGPAVIWKRTSAVELLGWMTPLIAALVPGSTGAGAPAVSAVAGTVAPATVTATLWLTSPVLKVPLPSLSANTRTLSPPLLAVNVSLQVNEPALTVQACAAPDVGWLGPVTS